MRRCASQPPHTVGRMPCSVIEAQYNCNQIDTQDFKESKRSSERDEGVLIICSPEMSVVFDPSEIGIFGHRDFR